MAFDNSDSSLWIKIGTLAAKEKRWKLARYALECGLVESQPEGDDTPHDPYRDFSEDHDLTPSQWSCLETLCEVHIWMRTGGTFSLAASLTQNYLVDVV